MLRTALMVLTNIFCLFVFTSCAEKTTTKKVPENMQELSTTELDTIILGGGCFWCTEAIFQLLNGVVSVQSGYSGGNMKNPSYKDICTGETGHAEAVEIVYDPKMVDLASILEVFFKTHDPTTLNRQGADAGTQYRSAIFYKHDSQKKTALEIINGLNNSGSFDAPIVTEVSPFSNFYKAEKYHQNYYNNNKNSNPYCQMVIVPKVEKFEQYFKDKLKK